MAVFLLATLDTKGEEAAFVRSSLEKLGVQVHLIDTGCIGLPEVEADTTRETVFEAAGTSLAKLVDYGDRGLAVTKAAEGAAFLVRQAWDANQLQGVLGLGGSAGTTIGTTAMRGLPLGVPKVMVSTLASGQTRPYVGDKDILMLNSVVDIAGLNCISRVILGNAAAAMAGLVQHPRSTSQQDRKLVAATMFGVTTPCVQQARELLEQAGYEVLVFHATGNGGQAMETLVRDGLIAGVLDITTTELADELVGGVLSAGPDRLTAASDCGVPQVVSVGATDMVNFGPQDTIPEEFSQRVFYEHNPTVTLMRTTAEENRDLGIQITAKVSQASGPAVIMLPLRGVSAIDDEGQPFENAQARAALFDAIRETRNGVELIEVDAHINDREFAHQAAAKLIAMMRT